MKDNISIIFIMALWGIGWISYFHGLYLSMQEGFGSFIIAMIIFPWAVIKGFIGFF